MEAVTYSRVCEAPSFPWFDENAYYKSALVYRLPPDLEGRVDQCRKLLADQVSAPYQTQPHMTLCYLGCNHGREMVELWHRLGKTALPRLEIRITGLATFERQGRVANIHARVQGTPDVQAAHEKTLRICRQSSWFQPGAYAGKGYIPHISIFEGIEHVDDLSDVVPFSKMLVGTHLLQTVCIMSLRLTPVMVVNLEVRPQEDLL